MCSKYYVLFFLILAFPFGKKLNAQPYSKLEKKIVRSIYKDSGIDVQKVPNLLVIYSHNGTHGTIHLDFYPTDTFSLNPNHLIQLGDISQFWTAQQILQLSRKGTLALSDQVNRFLPQGYQNDSSITIQSLLTHQSGLPKIPTNFGQYEKNQSNPYQYYSDTALLEFFRDYELAQNNKYRYSLVNYALLQYILKANDIPPLQANPKTPSNIGHKAGKPITPISYYQFACAKGLQMTPNQLFDYLIEAKKVTQSYPIFPTKIQKKTYSSYGCHVIKSHKHQIALLKGAVNGFTVIAAFDRERDKTLVVVADSQDYTGRLYHALSWFFR